MFVHDLAGKTFGTWSVLSRAPSEGKGSLWFCRCSCGAERVIRGGALARGATRSCGAFRCKKAKAMLGGPRVRDNRDRKQDRTGRVRWKRDGYFSWRGMIARCTDATRDDYRDYGARGVTVCERWAASLDAFLEDMGPRPSKIHSVDRYPNQSGNYEPGNCRWATPIEQAQNMRSNILLTHAGETLVLSEWARRRGIKPATMFGRLRMGWPVARVIDTPARYKRKKATSAEAPVA